MFLQHGQIRVTNSGCQGPQIDTRYRCVGAMRSAQIMNGHIAKPCPAPSSFPAPPQRHLGHGEHTLVPVDSPALLTLYNAPHGASAGYGSRLTALTVPDLDDQSVRAKLADIGP